MQSLKHRFAQVRDRCKQRLFHIPFHSSQFPRETFTIIGIQFAPDRAQEQEKVDRLSTINVQKSSTRGTHCNSPIRTEEIETCLPSQLNLERTRLLLSISLAHNQPLACLNNENEEGIGRSESALHKKSAGQRLVSGKRAPVFA